MKKWWIGAAVAAMCVGQSVRAQDAPGGALPEPVPVAPCPGNLDFLPGPLTGATAPPGPDTGLTLPADIPTAWGRGPMPESAAYFSLGGMGLMRQRPGGAVIAQVGQPPATVPVLTTNDLDPPYFWGGRATFGYLCDDAAIELTGFYLPEQSSSASFIDPGQLNLFFHKTPAGFQGPSGAGLLTRADAVVLDLKTSMGDAELNYRWWSRAFTGTEGILGFRYMNVQERADITAGSVTSGQASGLPPQQLEAIYMARANNNLLMAQTGFEWNLPLFKCLSLGVMAKGAFGADYITATTRVSNGAGFVGANARRDDWTYASTYEVNVFLDIVQFEKMRLRFGYTALWLVHVAEGFQQVNFDLSQQPTIHDSGSIFYHGPMVELQFLF
jgi:hypothetical protein